MEWALLVIPGVGAFLLLLRMWPRSVDSRARDAYLDWAAECRALGMTERQMNDESTLRMAMARVRRAASERTLESPKLARAIVDEEVKRAAAVIASRNKVLGRKFAKVVDELNLSEILYEDAMKAADPHLVPKGPGPRSSAEQDSDFLAAFTSR